MKESVWERIREHAQELRDLSEQGQTLSQEEKENIFRERAHKLSRSQEEITPTEKRVNFISFQTANNSYGIEAQFVDEVYETDHITRIPCVPAHFSGIINFRGSAVTVINLQKIFNLRDDKKLEYPVSILTNSATHTLRNPKKKIVIIRMDGASIGICTDSIDRLVEIPLTQIRPVSPVLLQKNRILQSEVIMKEKTLLILDIKALLKDSRLIVNENV